jgi:Tc5 transposase DNA-binding domain
MPPPKDTESTQKEGRMALAIQAFKQGQFKSLLAATKAYDAPYSTAYERVKGRPARRDSRSPNQKLTDTEESTLVQWILSMDERGLLLRADSVRQMANLLLQKRSNTDQDKTPSVGKCWVRNFVRRHESLQMKYTRKYDYQRAKCEDPRLTLICSYTIVKDDVHLLPLLLLVCDLRD